jgi:Ca2+-binding RTX toxin-like protein
VNAIQLAPLSRYARVGRQLAGFAVVCGAAVLLTTSVARVPASDAGPRCFGRSPTIVGNNGKNQLVGTKGRDVIIARGGNDSIRSRQGKDFVCAGPGNDNVHAAEGAGYMKGGPGDDWLDARLSRQGNVSKGGRGDDLIQADGKIDGGRGNDEIESFGYFRVSGISPDVTHGGGGSDTIRGCSDERGCHPWTVRDAEPFKGGGGNDRIFAGGGDDQVRGNGGNDTLHGEGGNDNIDGGADTDVCEQGSGTGTLRNCP